MFSNHHNSHSSSSLSSDKNSFSSYSDYDYDLGTQRISHWLATMLYQIVISFGICLLLTLLFPELFLEIFLIALPFSLIFMILAYFCFWKPEQNCDYVISYCSGSTLFLGVVFFLSYLTSVHPLKKIDQKKASYCQIINGEKIYLGNEQYSALNISLITQDGQHVNGYGCLSSKSENINKEMFNSPFLEDINICVTDKESNITSFTEHLSYNEYYDHQRLLTEEEIQKENSEENQQDLEDLTESEDLQSNQESYDILRAGGRGGVRNYSGSKSYSVRKSYGRRNSYSSATTIFYFGHNGGYGERGYGDGSNCESLFRYASVKLPGQICEDIQSNNIRFQQQCYYSTYQTQKSSSTTNVQQGASEILNPRLQESFHMVTFDKNIVYSQSLLYMLLIFFLAPYLACGCLCCFISRDETYSLEKKLNNWYTQKYGGKVHHKGKHHKSKQQQNNDGDVQLQNMGEDRPANPLMD